MIKNNDSRKEILRDERGRYLKGTTPGPGRPPQKTSIKIKIMKDQILDTFFENNGAQLFAELMKSHMGHRLQAFKLLLKISNTGKIEVSQNSDGKKSMKITREITDEE